MILPLLLMPTLIGAKDISAKSATIIDGASGKVLWARAADTPRFPASTTKIMTGMLLLEHCKPDEILVAPPGVEKYPESSMHLKVGERIRAKDMLYALMLRSANDGCFAVAKHISGSVDGFSELMNARAREIGCTHTHFHNPNGLNDPLHTTTAHDLALMAREAMQYEPFREAVKTYRVKINRGTNWKDVWMVNHDKLLLKDPTSEGIKTGFTNPAGRCFVGAATREGWRAITVALKSNDWQKDTREMLDWAYHLYEKRDEVAPVTIVGTAKVEGGEADSVALSPERAAYNLVRRDAPEGSSTVSIEAPPVTAPVRQGQKVGQMVLRDADGFEQKVPLIAQADIAVTTSAAALTTARKTGSNLWIPGGMLIGAYLIKGRGRRRTLHAKSTAKAR